MRILVTGCAGFIAAERCYALEKNFSKIIGIDIFNNYYSVSLKKLLIKIVKNKLVRKFKFIEVSSNDKKELEKIFLKIQISKFIDWYLKYEKKI